jgi:hypothetical protein
MFQFGAGNLWATQTSDAYGNTVALPTPIQLGVLQDIQLDISADSKVLHGQNMFPVDIGRGKGKVSLKAKAANINATAFNALFFGQSLAAGMFEILNDTTGSVIASGAVAITPSGGYTWVSNLGVRDANGNPYTRVASAPAVGQYSIAVAGGTATYTFNASDNGKTVFIDYKMSISTQGKTLAMQNLPMGYMPFFSLEFSQKRNGKGQTLTMPRVSSTKLGMSTKQDDFTIPEIDMEAIADEATGNVLTWTAWQ